MSPSEYNIIALIALVGPIVLEFSGGKDRSFGIGFLFTYGISFLIILLIAWLVKLIFN